MKNILLCCLSISALSFLAGCASTPPTTSTTTTTEETTVQPAATQ